MIGALLKMGSKDLFVQKGLFLKTPYILVLSDYSTQSLFEIFKKIVRYISQYTVAQLGKVARWNSASTPELRVPSFNPADGFDRPLEADFVTRLSEIFPLNKSNLDLKLGQNNPFIEIFFFFLEITYVSFLSDYGILYRNANFPKN